MLAIQATACYASSRFTTLVKWGVAMSTRRITVSLPSEDYGKLSVLAARHRVSIGWLLRLATSQLLSDLDDGRQMPLPLPHTTSREQTR